MRIFKILIFLYTFSFYILKMQLFSNNYIFKSVVIYNKELNILLK